MGVEGIGGGIGRPAWEVAEVGDTHECSRSRLASTTFSRCAIIVGCGVSAPELYDVGGSDFVEGGLSRMLVVVNLVVGDGPGSFASFAGRLHSWSLSGWLRRSSCVRGSPPRRAQ